jgi:hypothetical protein
MRASSYPLALAACLAGLTVLALEPASPKTEAADEVELKMVRYRDLCAAVRAQRGKVIVVEIWAEY